MTTYRGPLLIWLIGNMMSAGVLAAIWLTASGSSTFGGYTREQLITYYIVGLLFQWIINWLPFYSVADDIKSGHLAVSVLLKPVSLYLSKFFDDIGWHVISVGIGLIGTIFLALFFSGSIAIELTLSKFLLLIPAVIMAIIIVFTCSLSLGLLAFWFTEVSFFDTIFWSGRLFLGGQGIPISFFPANILWLINLLPFRYMFSFPMEILFRNLTNNELLFGFLMQIVWVVIFWLIYRLFWYRGRIAYTSFGH